VTAPLRIGSLCSGYGGLDLAVQAVIGGELAFVADPDEGAAKILAHHHPHVPNLGDITEVKWADVPPVDVLTTGFPCTDLSVAGLQQGLTDSTRSGLWRHCAKAISELRPPLVVIENVPGIRYSPANRGLGPDGTPLEERTPGSLRALGAVLGDLADRGFDAEWVSVSASDVGAPHKRERVFILAWPADAEGPRLEVGREGRLGGAAAPQDADGAVGGERRLPAPGQAPIGRPWADAGRRGGAPAADTGHRGESERPRPPRWAHGQRPPVGGEPGRGRSADADPDRDRRQRVERGEPEVGSRGDADGRRPIDWGRFTSAIRRWERVTGRPAPAPTRPDGQNGGHRLSPVFVEWLMGLPGGWVTSPLIGLKRADQLHKLGNGVVWQQGEFAFRLLLQRVYGLAA
jgi:DNA (cytosine-5)-methyltransferase 1